jgi:oxygen-independent coproporphyrinogen III oxidase
MQITEEISLYFHIPFCRKKCPYCSFYVIPENERQEIQLFQALKLEWRLYERFIKKRKVVSIYFGGGTPSLFNPKYIETILSWINPDRSVEITLEANPENICKETVRPLVDIGINRISLGVQSFDEKTLQLLQRGHTPQKASQAIEDVASSGIENISIDLMYEIPTQKIDSWIATVNYALEMPITHLSLYNLTFEPRTVFFKNKSTLVPQLPSSAQSLEMLNFAVDCIEKKLKRYEISAFAKNGFESKHNSGYWKGIDFLGFGPSAFSYWEGSRYQNFCNLQKYSRALDEGKSPIAFTEKLSPTAALHEKLAIALRLLDGVKIAKYPIASEIYHKLINKGWLCVENGIAKLTKQGLLFYDSVAEEIVLLENNFSC